MARPSTRAVSDGDRNVAQCDGQMEAHTIEKTLNVLEREFRSIGLGQDLTRLAKCCEVDVDGKVMYSSALRKSKATESEAVEDLIFQLIRWLDGQEAQADAETKYSEFMSRDGNDPDDPEATERFFEEVLGSDECHVIQLLKSCTQAALAPCNIELKMLLTKSNLTKEVPNSWRVDISFGDETVLVKSRKQEQCVKNLFRYEWEVRFEYDAESVKCQKVTCSVVDLMFHKLCHEGKEKSKKVVIKNLIETHITKAVLDASESRNWVYNPKRAGQRGSGQPSSTQLKTKKPDLLASFLNDVNDEKGIYSPEAVARAAASRPDDSSSQASDSDEEKKAKAKKSKKSKKGVSIAPPAAARKTDSDDEAEFEAQQRKKEVEEKKAREEGERQMREKEEEAKKRKQREEEATTKREEEKAQKTREELEAREKDKSKKEEEEKRDKERKVKELLDKKKEQEKKEKEEKEKKEQERKEREEKEKKDLALREEAERKEKEENDKKLQAQQLKEKEEKEKRESEEREENDRKLQAEKEKEKRESEARAAKEKEEKDAAENKEKEEKERKEKEEKEKRDKELLHLKKEPKKGSSIHLSDTGSDGGSYTKPASNTPRRERLKASDTSSPKSSAQQLIENEPAKFKAAVEAKERERQAKDAGDAELPLIEYPNGDTYQGELNAAGERAGRGVYTNSRGDVYIGEYKSGKKHGKGIFSRADGSRYEGEFRNGMFNGYGVYVYENGDIYAGTFENDEFSGQGRWSSVKKDFYEGQFQAGKRHGVGIYSYGNGAKYDGEWKEGLFSGKGNYLFSNKDRYIGEFVAGKFHGRGKYVSANGKVVDGEFASGKPVKK